MYHFPVVALDFLDTANQDKIPRFQEVNEVYSKELESSVLFPNLLAMPKKSKGCHFETCFFILQVIFLEMCNDKI